MDRARFLELCTPVAELAERKSQDYQGGPVKHVEYFVFGHKSFVQMLRTKVLRLTSLVSSDTKPNFEGIADSVDDLLAYTVFYLDYLHPKATEAKVPTATFSKPYRELKDE